MQKLGRGSFWLCHISRSDLGHGRSGDRTLQQVLSIQISQDPLSQLLRGGQKCLQVPYSYLYRSGLQCMSVSRDMLSFLATTHSSSLWWGSLWLPRYSLDKGSQNQQHTFATRGEQTDGRAGTDGMVQERPHYALILALQHDIQRKNIKSWLHIVQPDKT